MMSDLENLSTLLADTFTHRLHHKRSQSAMEGAQREVRNSTKVIDPWGAHKAFRRSHRALKALRSLKKDGPRCLYWKTRWVPSCLSTHLTRASHTFLACQSAGRKHGCPHTWMKTSAEWEPSQQASIP